MVERKVIMPDISICIVSLNCIKVIRDCLESLQLSKPIIDFETILVDNNSSDNTAEFVNKYFPDVIVIRNNANVGFTKATNQAINISKGKYILWLNPDTILKKDSLSKLAHFLDIMPKAGIVGPKVLNPDGTFQPQCKRGFPTPLAYISYKLYLDRLFPNDVALGQYLLKYLPDDKPARVGAVDGCCLLARRDLWMDIGPLDESIFAYGEDLDWCMRAIEWGWEVWYYPESEIIHLRGQGGAHFKPFCKIRAMHESFWIIYCKHFRKRYSWPMTLLFKICIKINLVTSLITTKLKYSLKS
jgi:GT2 family glycosyltransferase